MPPLCFHLGIARAAVPRLPMSEVSQNLGSYYLGVTSPDIRLITGAPREETHFFDLVGDASGVPKFFQTSPELARAGLLPPETSAFVAGYLSHLVTDEAWIIKVYRPCFGKGSPLGDDPKAPLLDRVLQFELDRSQRARRDEMAEVRAAVCGMPSLPTLGFLEAGYLKRWHNFVCEAAGREPSWERFGAFARSVVAKGEELSPETLQELLGRARQAVPPQRLGEYLEESVSASVKAAEDYFGCR